MIINKGGRERKNTEQFSRVKKTCFHSTFFVFLRPRRDAACGGSSALVRQRRRRRSSNSRGEGGPLPASDLNAAVSSSARRCRSSSFPAAPSIELAPLLSLRRSKPLERGTLEQWKARSSTLQRQQRWQSVSIINAG